MKTEKQYRYRIYTEDKNPATVQQIVAEYFDGFTVFFGAGIWKGKSENNLTIEIICCEPIGDVTIPTICKRINQLNSQDCCLVTVEPIETVYI